MDILTNHSYPSRRSVVYSPKGMVATSQHLAAQAGLDVLKRGGNAIDAAVAAAMVLTVVEPCSNGIGGDAFAIISSNGKLYGLNSSGPAPLRINAEAVKKLGYSEMPIFGLVPVTVPGIPAAWAALNERFGTMPLKDVAAQAIDYGENGFPVSPVVSLLWNNSAVRFSKVRSEKGIDTWFDTYTQNGQAPEAGDLWRLPDHAATLRRIAESNAGDFYRGDIADRIDAYFRREGGFLRKEDLEAFQPQWVEPVSINYRGYDVWELPPNGQGIVALMALNMLKGFDFTEKESVTTYHRQIEAIKIAFADGKKYITDPHAMDIPVGELLSETFAEERRRLIGDKAGLPVPGKPAGSDTVYLCTADSEGNMVSYIQSNYMGFGSGVVVPGTGIAMHNRGNGFSLDESDYNCIAPGKRTYHTIIPGFLTKDGRTVGPFGMMGGFMQPQGHVQMLMNSIDFDLNLQAAIDASRWQWIENTSVLLEHGVPEHIAWGLRQKGHKVSYSMDFHTFGRAQMICRNEKGGFFGATEPRADGAAAGW